MDGSTTEKPGETEAGRPPDESPAESAPPSLIRRSLIIGVGDGELHLLPGPVDQECSRRAVTAYAFPANCQEQHALLDVHPRPLER